MNDKLIGGICGPHGLVLTWRPDGLGMVCQLIRLCSAPHPLQERLFRERKDLFKWAPSPSDCSRSSRSLTKAGFIFTDWDCRWHVLVVFLDIKEGMFQDKLWKDSAILPNNKLILWRTLKMISLGIHQATSYRICWEYQHCGIDECHKLMMVQW